MKKQNLTIAILAIIILMQTACSSNSFTGTWQYDGGIYDAKPQAASADFKMQRTYTTNKYEAFVIEGENQPKKYGSGRYEIKGDTFLVTSEYSAQPSQLVGKTIAYKFKIDQDQDKLTIKGTLPNGMKVEEYWKKIK